MKQYLLFILFIVLLGGELNAQIQYSGCNGTIAAGYPITLELSGNDGVRNSYTNTLPGTPCSAGSCTFRVIWTGLQWEIQLSTNGGTSFTNVLYINTVASLPNPPDLTLGTWIGQGLCAGQTLQVFSGDVQSNETLSISNYDSLKELTLIPNPATSVLNIESNMSIKQIRIFNVLGKEIMNTTSKTIDVSQLNQGMYLIEIEGDSHQTIIKRFIKK